MVLRLLICLVMLAPANSAFAGPIRDDVRKAVLAPVQMRARRPLNTNAMIVSRIATGGARATFGVLLDTTTSGDTVLCGADRVLSCQYGTGPKESTMLWDMRLAGASVVLTMRGTDISIERGRVKLSRSVTF